MSEYQIPIKIEIPGCTSSHGPLSKPRLGDVISWIKKKNLDAHTERKLIEIASNHPPGAYPQFRKNFISHLNKIQKERNAE
jgi:hypothetical protein